MIINSVVMFSLHLGFDTSSVRVFHDHFNPYSTSTIGYSSVDKALAEQATSILITQIQLNSVIEHLSLADQLKVLNVSGSPTQFYAYLSLSQNQFHIYYEIQDSKTHFTTYNIWLEPHAVEGTVVCLITKLQVDNRLLTEHELTLSNPYITSLTANQYCNVMLSPFLAGYGNGARVKAIRVKDSMIFIDLDGSLNPMAPSPAIVAGCKVVDYDEEMNLRSGPGLNFPVLKVVYHNEATVLQWQDGWVEVNHQGTVGWLWGSYVYGDDECLANTYGPTQVWDIFRRGI